MENEVSVSGGFLDEEKARLLFTGLDALNKFIKTQVPLGPYHIRITYSGKEADLQLDTDAILLSPQPSTECTIH